MRVVMVEVAESVVSVFAVVLAVVETRRCLRWGDGARVVDHRAGAVPASDRMRRPVIFNGCR